MDGSKEYSDLFTRFELDKMASEISLNTSDRSMFPTKKSVANVILAARSELIWGG